MSVPPEIMDFMQRASILGVAVIYTPGLRRQFVGFLEPVTVESAMRLLFEQPPHTVIEWYRSGVDVGHAIDVNAVAETPRRRLSLVPSIQSAKPNEAVP
jgi:hypothetical protein